MAKTTLGLCLIVSSGSTDWSKSCTKLEPHLRHFDEVIISVCAGSGQNRNVQAALAAVGKRPHVRVVSHGRALPLGARLRLCTVRLQTDHVLFLCGQDRLLSPGMRELRRLLDEGPEGGILCTRTYASTGAQRAVTVRGLQCWQGGIPRERFVMSLLDYPADAPLSGVVLPSRGTTQMLRYARHVRDEHSLHGLMLGAAHVPHVRGTQAPVVCVRGDRSDDGLRDCPRGVGPDPALTWYAARTAGWAVLRKRAAQLWVRAALAGGGRFSALHGCWTFMHLLFDDLAIPVEDKRKGFWRAIALALARSVAASARRVAAGLRAPVA